MENYIVSARKYRPSTFASVVGQKALTATLRNSISKERLAHAYLFTGSRGVGKTSCARIFAKTINCEHRTPDGEACNECASCREFNEGRSLNIIELDAASNNGIDDMRNLIDQVQVPPVHARYRVFIIDEVHMLSSGAFNAFLKTLEEPPSYVIFILATTEKHKIIPTILSRCQIYDFNRITINDMVEHLAYVAAQEGITAEPAALNVIARKADGAMRDALSIFDQVAASSMGNVTYKSTVENLNILDHEYYDRLVEAMLTGNVPQALLIYKDIREKGFDSQFFITGLASHFRDLMVARDPSTMSLLEADEESRQAMAKVAQQCTPQFLYKAMDLCNDADLNYRVASNKQFLVELTLIKLCQQIKPEGDSGNKLSAVTASQPASASNQPLKTTATPPKAAPAAPQPANQATPQPVSNQPLKAPVNPQPAVAPQAAPSQPASPRRHQGLRTPGLSLKSTVTQANEQSAEYVRETPRRSTDFTDAQFVAAWQGVIDSHPKEHLLINAMRVAHPQRIEGARYGVTVESEAIRDSIVQSMPMLLEELHNRLDNDFVTLDITLNKGQATATSLTDGEVYSLMRRKYPYLNNVIDDLHLTML